MCNYSFTVSVSHMLVLLEKIFGGKFEDIMGKSRKLHTKEHHRMCTRQLLRFKSKVAEICNTCDTYIRVEVPFQTSCQKT